MRTGSGRRILIVYGTKHGQTSKIAHRMAERLRTDGHHVALADGDGFPSGATLQEYDGVIVGSSVLYNRYRRSIRRFVREHRGMLNAKPSAFFSVSGTAASTSAGARDSVRRLMDAFTRSEEWRPTISASIAGATAYTRYSPFMRWMIRRIAVRNGGPTDTTRDHEFTDWVQVDRFADAFSEALAGAPASRPVATV